MGIIIGAKGYPWLYKQNFSAIVPESYPEKVSKPMNPFRIAILLLLCLVATACGAAPSQEAAVASTPTAAAPEALPASAQEESAPAEAAETPEAAARAETDWLTVEGKTEDNLTFLGNPEAPVTLIDHSDFL
jgi:hypothetical protein